MITLPCIDAPARGQWCARLALWMLLLAIAPAALAQTPDPGFLGNLPTAAQVMARFGGGGDPVQSLGRQCAALNILERRFFRSSAIMTRAVAAHAATKKVQGDYGRAFVALRDQYAAAVGGIDDPKQRTWSAMCDNRSPGGLDQPVTLDEVLALVPASVKSGYAAAFARSDRLVAEQKAREEAARDAERARLAREEIARAKRAEEERERRWIAIAIAAVGGLVFSLSARTMYRIGKYRFENTTDGGVVQYESYGAAIRQSLLGQVTGVVFLISGLVTAGGIALLISTL